MIEDIAISKAADQYADPDGCSAHDGEKAALAATKFFAFRAGAKWALEKESVEIYNALKGLGLEKHSIALNVLKIAGININYNNK